MSGLLAVILFSVEVNGATLRLADLAGSEKWRTEELRDYSKHRIKELTSINQSLSALANVVSALKDGRPHVPYRASKLTRLLRDAFAEGPLRLRRDAVSISIVRRRDNQYIALRAAGHARADLL